MLATLIGVCGLLAHADATSAGGFNIDSSPNSGNDSLPAATSGGLVWLQNGVAAPRLNTGTDINLTILWGLSPDAVNNQLDMDPLIAGVQTAWYASQSSGNWDIRFFADGSIADPNGGVYTSPGWISGENVYFVLEAWTGSAASYGVANNAISGVYVGQTAAFAVTLSDASLPVTNIRAMPALVLVNVPEPAVTALVGLGALSLVLFRRRG